MGQTFLTGTGPLSGLKFLSSKVGKIERIEYSNSESALKSLSLHYHLKFQ